MAAKRAQAESVAATDSQIDGYQQGEFDPRKYFLTKIYRKKSPPVEYETSLHWGHSVRTQTIDVIRLTPENSV